MKRTFNQQNWLWHCQFFHMLINNINFDCDFFFAFFFVYWKKIILVHIERKREYFINARKSFAKKKNNKKPIVTADEGKRETDSSKFLLCVFVSVCVPLLLWFDLFKTFEILSFLHRSKLFSIVFFSSFELNRPLAQLLYQQWSTSMKNSCDKMRNKTTKIYKMKWQMNSNSEYKSIGIYINVCNVFKWKIGNGPIVHWFCAERAEREGRQTKKYETNYTSYFFSSSSLVEMRSPNLNMLFVPRLGSMLAISVCCFFSGRYFSTIFHDFIFVF